MDKKEYENSGYDKVMENFDANEMYDITDKDLTSMKKNDDLFL